MRGPALVETISCKPRYAFSVKSKCPTLICKMRQRYELTHNYTLQTRVMRTQRYACTHAAPSVFACTHAACSVSFHWSSFRPDVRGSNETWKPQSVTAATSMQTPRRPVMSQRLPISSPFAFLTRSHTTDRPTSRGTNRRDSGNHSFSLLGYLVPTTFHPGPS